MRSFKFGEANLMGEAIYAVLEWRNRPFFRDEVTARFADYQFFGKPYQLTVLATRRDIGHTWQVEASHPFLTDLQRSSWRTTAGDENRYRYFTRKNELPAALLVKRKYGDVGGVVRVGPPGKLFFVGGSLSREREETSDRPVVIRDIIDSFRYHEFAVQQVRWIEEHPNQWTVRVSPGELPECDRFRDARWRPGRAHGCANRVVIVGRGNFCVQLR